MEIDVTLRFGERRLPLREISELRSGSVVELDKSLQDPAELLLGDRVVARGEVVIVDGNYGMRITEVVSPTLSWLSKKLIRITPSCDLDHGWISS
ncbi:MAG: FliM/FliN family flagellar motor switch protein [Terriglobales bacterium]